MSPQGAQNPLGPLQGAQDLWFLLNLKGWDTAIPGILKSLARFFSYSINERSGGALELPPLSPALTQLCDSTQGNPRMVLDTQGCIQNPHIRTPGFVFLPFPKSSFLTASQSTRSTLPKHLWLPFPCRELLTHPFLSVSNLWTCRAVTHRATLEGLTHQHSPPHSVLPLGPEQDHGHTKATSPEWGLAAVALCSTNPLTAAGKTTPTLLQGTIPSHPPVQTSPLVTTPLQCRGEQHFHPPLVSTPL